MIKYGLLLHLIINFLYLRKLFLTICKTMVLGWLQGFINNINMTCKIKNIVKKNRPIICNGLKVNNLCFIVNIKVDHMHNELGHARIVFF
jgi:hypothetical protein